MLSRLCGLAAVSASGLLACVGQVDHGNSIIDGGPEATQQVAPTLDSGAATASPDSSLPADSEPAGDGHLPPCTTPGITFGAPAVVFANLPAPSQLAIDDANLYVASYELGPVFEVPLDGGAVVTLDAIGQNNVAINSSGVYTVAGGGGNVPQGIVAGCAKTGCGGIYTLMASGQNNVWGVAADDDNVYWANQSGGAIAKVPVGGGTPTTLATDADGTIAVSQGNVLFVKDPNLEELWAVPAAGGPPRLLYAPPSGGVGTIAADADYVFFSTLNNNTIGRVPLQGGPAITLATGVNFAPALTVDATNVYWADDGNGAVVTVPICGGAVTTLAAGQKGPGGIAVDANNVYWSNLGDGTIMKLPKLGQQ